MTVTYLAGLDDKRQLTIQITANSPPVITNLSASPQTVEIGGTVGLTCSATDADGDDLSYSWSESAGSAMTLPRVTMMGLAGGCTRCW